MDFTTLVNEKLICLDGKADSRNEALDLLGNKLVAEKYVQPAYITAIKKRELDFPTGIMLENLGVALPHATPEGNVAKDGIAVLKLNQPVVFNSMENPDDAVQVSLIVMLALSASDQHLSMLQKLFGMFQQSEVMEKLLSAADAKAFREIMLAQLQ